MHLSTGLVSFGLMTSAVVAAPHKLKARSPGGDVVVYWGQGTQNDDLSTYCTADSGIDILVLSFLYTFGGSGATIPSGTIGPDCSVSSTGEGSNCDSLASEIETCKSNGVKILLSLGGADGSYSLSSQTEAETIGQNLWDAYGNTSNGGASRPFGKTFIDGWDFDIESNSGNEYYQYLISKLRSNFASDSSNEYYISGAPQCPIPEPNMGEIVTKAQFDYLWVQFYNNPYCSYPNTPNFDDWVTYVSGTPSADAKIFLGVPASELASTGTSSGSKYYMAPATLAEQVTSFDTSSNWGGIMMWDAGTSDGNVVDGCTYAQQAHSILKTGSACGGSSSGSSTSSSTSSPAGTQTSTSTASASDSVSLQPTSSTAVSTPTATTWPTIASSSSVAIPSSTASPSSAVSSSGNTTPVPQWGQCGGIDYTGSTTCASPYKCVVVDSYWSSCQ